MLAITLMETTKIASNIRRYRKKLNWSQEQVAREAGIPFTTYTKIENGTTKNPSIETLVKIARALKVSMDSLLNNSNNNNNE